MHVHTPFQRRNSLFRASVTDLRKGLSRSDDKRERTRPFGVPTDDLVLSALSSPSVYGQASHRSRLNSAAARQRQQYAAASPHLGQPSSIQTDSQNKKRELYDKSSKKVPAHLRPSSRASLLKASVSTPDLHSASRQSAMYVKTKARWLAAETWCDAFMFPRPRFLLRHLEEGSATPNHRFVSSAESIVSEAVGPSAEPKSLKKSQSVAELRTSGFPKEIPTRVNRNDAPRSPSAARPKSFALDDLALPSPVPSLITYVFTSKKNESISLTVCTAFSPIGKTSKMSVRCGRSVPQSHLVIEGLEHCQDPSHWEKRKSLPTNNFTWEPLTFW